jgi:hypothetical protein
MSTFNIKPKTIVRQSFQHRKKLIGNPFSFHLEKLSQDSIPEKKKEFSDFESNESESEEEEEEISEKPVKRNLKTTPKKKYEKKRKLETIEEPKKKQKVDLECNWNADETEKYPLKESIIQRIKSLKGEISTVTNPQRRFYSKTKTLIPESVQFFLDIKWPNNIKCK